MVAALRLETAVARIITSRRNRSVSMGMCLSRLPTDAYVPTRLGREGLAQAGPILAAPPPVVLVYGHSLALHRSLCLEIIMAPLLVLPYGVGTLLLGIAIAVISHNRRRVTLVVAISVGGRVSSCALAVRPARR